MILENIVSFRDIFYYFTDFLSYETLISLTMINKDMNEQIKKYHTLDLFKKRRNEKMIERPSRVLYSSDLSQELFDSLLPLETPISLTREMFRELYISRTICPSDIIKYNQFYFILDIDKIYSMLWWNELYLPKTIQEKFGLSRWINVDRSSETFPRFNAFVKVDIDDFDFDRIECFFRRHRETFVKIWNRRYKIDMIMYIPILSLGNISNDNYKISEISRNKIIDIIRFSKIYRNTTEVFYHQDDVRIFTYHQDDLCGWFLE